MRDLGPFSVGTAHLGNLYEPLSDVEARTLLDAAWEAGVRYFDTAPHYGLGLAERRLGAFLATKPRHEFVVSTKVGRLLVADPQGATRRDDDLFAVPADHRRVWDASADGVRRSLAESLERLGLAAVDVLYLHDPEEHDLDDSLRTALPALADLRDGGVVSAVGVGSKSTEALLAAARSGHVDLLMVANRLTLLDQSALDELLPECRHRGIGVVAAAVFNSGLLATNSPSPEGRYDYGPVPDEVLDRAREIAAVCAEFEVELPAAALRYPLCDPVVRTVVVGPANAEQVRDNRRSVSATVPPELWSALRDKGLVRR